MKKKIGVITKDDFLYQKIYLALRESENLVALRGAEGADALLCDAEYAEQYIGALIMSRSAAADLPIPFTPSELVSLFADGKAAPALTLGNKVAFMHGKEIKLTEVEFSLLSILSRTDGFVSRGELIREVWGEGVDGGVLNVYVHYLREKLEFMGEKVIISSRKLGYKIDEKYLGREVMADA